MTFPDTDRRRYVHMPTQFDRISTLEQNNLCSTPTIRILMALTQTTSSTVPLTRAFINHKVITTPVKGTEIAQKIQNRPDTRTSLFLSLSSNPKSKKLLPKSVAINVLGRKSNVMIAIVFMDLLSRPIRRLSRCVTILKDYGVELVLGDLAGLFVESNIQAYQIRDIRNSSLKTCQTELR